MERKKRRVGFYLSEQMYIELEKRAQERNYKSVPRFVADLVRDYLDRKAWEDANARLNIENVIREVIHYEINPIMMDLVGRINELLEVLKKKGVDIDERKASEKIIDFESELEYMEPPMMDDLFSGEDEGDEPEVPLNIIDNTFSFLKEKTVNEDVIESLRETLEEEKARIRDEVEEFRRWMADQEWQEQERLLNEVLSDDEEKPQEKESANDEGTVASEIEEDERPLIDYGGEYPIVKDLKVLAVHPRFVRYEDGSIWDRANKRWHKTGRKLAKIRIEAGEPV